jgi:hypothetical protein
MGLRFRFVWVVRDATPVSVIEDVCWRADIVTLARQVIGAGGPQVVKSEHWTFFTDEASAKHEATLRLAKR